VTDEITRGRTPEPDETNDETEAGDEARPGAHTAPEDGPAAGAPAAGDPGSIRVPLPRDGGAVIPGPWAGAGGPSGAGGGAGEAGHGLAGVEEFDLRAPADVEHCYRHPDRETGVSCSNCGRPICWECMTPAPVGFRCPECMGRTRAERRSAPVITRGQIRDRWAGGLMGGGAPVTRVLVAVNVAAFVLEMLLGGSGLLRGTAGGSLFEWGALWPPAIAYEGEYWRLLTPMFLHSGIFHILFNMWALWVVGGVMEPMIGSARFAGIYFVSGFAGNVVAFAIAPPTTVMVGASTAIFGIFGALFVLGLHDRSAWASGMVRGIGFLLLINLVITFLFPGISWQGHIGGLIGGVLATEALIWFGHRRLSGRFRLTDALLLAAVAGLFVLIVAWRVGTFPSLT